MSLILGINESEPSRLTSQLFCSFSIFSEHQADILAFGAGDAEGLGRLNLVAASAALADTAQVVSTREAIAKERSLWLSVLGELNLPHTDSRANFVFF